MSPFMDSKGPLGCSREDVFLLCTLPPFSISPSSWGQT